MPILREIRSGGTYRVLGDNAIVVRWQAGDVGELILAANLSGGTTGGFPAAAGRWIWREGEAGDDGVFGPYAVRWSLADKNGHRHG